MKAAIVQAAGQPPVYGDFPEPLPSAGECRVTVTAAALSPLVRARASGAHYSSSAEFPFVAGVDGVGRLEDGTRVYFVLPREPYGAMAERTPVSGAQCIRLPDDLDDLTAAAIANPGMSSWAAYVERAKLKAGETVLVNGATGAAGRLAVQIAKHFGARKVIATGRDAEALQDIVALGADVAIPLVEHENTLEKCFKEQFAEGVDVVIDYLWGRSATCILIAAAKAAAQGIPIRFVQVGSASGPDITLPAAVLRSSAITMMGSGLGSVSNEGLLRSISGLLRAAAPAGFQIATQSIPLTEVEREWSRLDSSRRTVFTLD